MKATHSLSHPPTAAHGELRCATLRRCYKADTTLLEITSQFWIVTTLFLAIRKGAHLIICIRH